MSVATSVIVIYCMIQYLTCYFGGGYLSNDWISAGGHLIWGFNAALQAVCKPYPNAYIFRVWFQKEVVGEPFLRTFIRK